MFFHGVRSGSSHINLVEYFASTNILIWRCIFLGCLRTGIGFSLYSWWAFWGWRCLWVGRIEIGCSYTCNCKIKLHIILAIHFYDQWFRSNATVVMATVFHATGHPFLRSTIQIKRYSSNGYSISCYSIFATVLCAVKHVIWTIRFASNNMHYYCLSCSHSSDCSWSESGWDIIPAEFEQYYFIRVCWYIEAEGNMVKIVFLGSVCWNLWFVRNDRVFLISKVLFLILVVLFWTYLFSAAACFCLIN